LLPHLQSLRISGFNVITDPKTLMNLTSLVWHHQSYFHPDLFGVLSSPYRLTFLTCLDHLVIGQGCEITPVPFMNLTSFGIQKYAGQDLKLQDFEILGLLSLNLR
jgi:hypothetical protein